jgi:hypothetical protein
MTQEIAEKNVRNWFWTFKHKLVDDFPEFQSTFDKVVTDSNEHGLLYEVFEFAFRYLEVEGEGKGGMNNLDLTDYLQALDYGYGEWIK